MKRKKYIDHITECLGALTWKVKAKNSLCLNDDNRFCENVYMDILNALNDWELVNANVEKKNAKAIDLIDRKRRILVQVSSRKDKSKIRRTLLGLDGQDVDGYKFYYLAITDDPPKWKTSDFECPPKGLIFNVDNIWGMQRLLRQINAADMEHLHRVYEVCQTNFSALGSQPAAKPIFTMEHARKFIFAYVDVYGELQVLRDICQGYVDGDYLGCGLQRIKYHLEKKLKLYVMSSIDSVEDFRRAVVGFTVLWQVTFNIENLLWELDQFQSKNTKDVKNIKSMSESIRKVIERAIDIVADLCPDERIFRYEFHSSLTS